jgi:hypothetical protein
MSNEFLQQIGAVAAAPDGVEEGGEEGEEELIGAYGWACDAMSNEPQALQPEEMYQVVREWLGPL